MADSHYDLDLFLFVLRERVDNYEVYYRQNMSKDAAKFPNRQDIDEWEVSWHDYNLSHSSYGSDEMIKELERKVKP